MENEIKKSGICRKCGKETDNLKVTIDSAVSDEPVEVCPECYEEIEVSNELYAKAIFVGCGVVFVFAFLIFLVALIVSVC